MALCPRVQQVAFLSKPDTFEASVCPRQAVSKPKFLLLCPSQSASLLQMAVPGSLLSIMRYATSKGFSFPDETTEDDLSAGSFSGGGRESVLPVQHGQWIAEQAGLQACREQHMCT